MPPRHGEYKKEDEEAKRAAKALAKAEQQKNEAEELRRTQEAVRARILNIFGPVDNW